MSTQVETLLKKQLSQRRQRLQAAAERTEKSAYLTGLLAEVDAALERMDNGSFGLCETCHEPIENDRLCADPLLRFCLDHLSPAQQRALGRDLELAGHIQRGLLPKPEVRGDNVERIDSAGLPLGLFCNVEFNSQKLSLHKGDSLVLYTDGISETLDQAGNEYGIERLMSRAREFRELPPDILIQKLWTDVSSFRAGGLATDDASIMVIRRSQ